MSLSVSRRRKRESGGLRRLRANKTRRPSTTAHHAPTAPSRSVRFRHPPDDRVRDEPTVDEWAAEGNARSASAGNEPSTLPRVSLATLQAAFPGVDFDKLRETPELTREEYERERASEQEKGRAVEGAAATAVDFGRPPLRPEEDGVVADAPVRRPVRRRTPQALLAVRGSIADSLPTGPWASDTLALAALNNWAADHRTHGGGFGLVWTHGRCPGNGRRGDQHRMGCDQHRKQGCGFSITVEETTDGWMVVAYAEHVETEGKVPVTETGHSHALTATLGERLAHATQREIPEALHADAQLMYKSGSTVKDVENWLRAKARDDGCVAAFTYHDVFRLVAASTSDRAWDATDFVEALQRRHAEHGHVFHIHLSDEGRLDRAFFLMDGALEIYAAGGTAQVVVFDTKVCLPTSSACLSPLSSYCALAAAQRRRWRASAAHDGTWARSSQPSVPALQAPDAFRSMARTPTSLSSAVS